MEDYDVVTTILTSSLNRNRPTRKYPRFNLTAKVTMQVNDQVIAGELVTISLNGAFVKADKIIEPGTDVIITIQDEPGSRYISEVKATVISVIGNGIGLQFDQTV